MKKVLALIVASAFTGAVSTSAMACVSGKIAKTSFSPITTALDSQPITPKPQTKSGS